MSDKLTGAELHHLIDLERQIQRKIVTNGQLSNGAKRSWRGQGEA